MKLMYKVWLIALAALVVAGVALGVVTYRQAGERVEADVLKTTQTVRDLLMTMRYTYHQRFLASGLPLTDQTLAFLPAHAMASISDDFQRFHRLGIRFRNVSDRARNPANQADAVELEAIQWFRAHPAVGERLIQVAPEGAPRYYFYATPIRVEAYCLTCHGDRAAAPAAIRERYDAGFGFRVGELRGVLGIKVPAAAAEAGIRATLVREQFIQLGGFILAMLVGGVLMQRLVIRRLQGFKDGALALARGDYAARLDVAGSDETAELSKAFNTMAATLQQRDHALRESEARWQFALEGSDQGVWDWDNASGRVFFSRRWKAMLGYADDEIGDRFEEWRSRVHPDDLARSEALLARHFARATAHYVNEHRLRRKDGGYAWILARGQVVEWAPGGGPQRMIGTNTDISRGKRFEAALAATAEFVSAPGGEHFVRDMVEHAARNLGLDYVHVARLIPGSRRVETLAAWLDGESIANGAYGLEFTPCAEVVALSRRCIESGVQAAYPRDADLRRIDAESYVGEPIVSSAGEALGLIVGITHAPLVDGDVVQANLRILAARAGAEFEQRDAMAALRASEIKFHTMVDWAFDWEYWVEPEGGFHYMTPSVERVTGYRVEDFYCNPALIDAIVHAEDRHLWRHHSHDHLAKGANEDIAELDFRVVRKDGDVVWVTHACRPVFDGEGRYLGRRVAVRDISARKEAETRIRHLAYFDPLTGLPNRRLLMDRLGQSLIASTRSLDYGALLILDLDRFKTLNEIHGHDVGDRLLVEVARRIVAGVRQEDTVSRLGGDEYVVMLEGLGGDERAAANQAETVAEKIRLALNQPYALSEDEPEHHSTPSIGVTLFRGQGDSAEVLLKQADVALYQAKDAGRNAVRFFNPDMQAAIESRSALEAGLRQGLQKGELHLHYQPQVDRHGRRIGAEALLRWSRPGLGMVSPAEFIPLAEESGLILPIGQWVVDTACAQIAAWQADPATRALTLAINVSARQFHQADFVAQVLASLARSGADPSRLKLELTESVVLDNVERVIGRMRELRAHGVRFSMDDFGTGYSSLSYLKRLPLDQLKIDQSFVREVTADPNDAAIVRAILAMSLTLGLDVIAEGVETPEQRDFLLGNGCTAFQGYLFGRPMPVEAWADGDRRME